MEKRDKLTIGVVMVVVMALWAATPFVSINMANRPANAGELGDIFGSVNSLFTGLAFVVLVATIILQSRELRQNTQVLKNQQQELEAQADALKKQVQLMTASAKLAAIPLLLDHRINMIGAVDPNLKRRMVECSQSWLLAKLREMKEEAEGLSKQFMLWDKHGFPDGTPYASLEHFREHNNRKWALVSTVETVYNLRTDMEETYNQIRQTA